MTSPTKPTRCGISPDDLHRAFDGEGAEELNRVSSHITACNPCGVALGVLEGQRDAMQFLVGKAAIERGETAIERILSIGALAGRQKFADLLYELSKATLVLVSDFRLRVECLTEPRRQAVVSDELRQVEDRLSRARGGDRRDVQPIVAADSDAALETTRRCLTVLLKTEGATVRQQLMLAQVHVYDNRLDLAEGLLRTLWRSGVSDHLELVLRNLTWVLNRQGRFAEAAVVGEEATAQCPGDVILLLNLASSVSHLGDRLKFDATARRISALIRRGTTAHARNLVSHESEHFAQELNAPIEDITRALGIGAIGAR